MSSEPTNSKLPSAKKIQKLFPDYSQVTFHAKGGIAGVYRARDESLNREVAIKVLPKTRTLAPRLRQIFQEEAQMMSELHHTNLVSIYDHGEVKGLLYIVMQFIEGRSLHELAHGRAVSPHESAKLISTICKALASAHRVNIVHRDIKPANILIGPNTNTFIIDFGLAHRIQDTTAKGERVYGTPGYTAPEVLIPPYRASPRADIFSLGVLLHELLTGELPREVYIPPSHLCTADSRYDMVVMRAIHPLPTMRYSSVNSLVNDLDNILANRALASSSLQFSPAFSIDDRR